MPTRWETFPILLEGGLVGNLSKLQHGLNKPGSAFAIKNFEPSIKGGYRRINGYTKFSDTPVPQYGLSLVQGSAQSGANLVLGGIHETPVVGDTFSIAGVTGTYTVATVSYSATSKEATLTVTPNLDSSPADKAAVTWTSGASIIEGIYYAKEESATYAVRGGALWSSTGIDWTLRSVPNYGTVLVSGGAQTGSALVVAGIDSDTYVPQVGDTFTLASVELTYTVTAIPTVTSGAATLAISPALDSSPADTSAVTFTSSSMAGGSRVKFKPFSFDGTYKTAIVDGANRPAVTTSTTFKTLQGTDDILGAQYCEVFKDHLFFAKDSLVSHSAPFDEEDFRPALGAGSYRLSPSGCTGLFVFREQLINFTEQDVFKLTGTSIADFSFTPITTDIGCVAGDTVQEVGGDLLFLGPDGARFLGATARIGDFALQVASKPIQDEFKRFIDSTTDFCSVSIRSKSQYRIFNFVPNTSDRDAFGYIGTQFEAQNPQSVAWGTTRGIQAYRAFSTYTNDSEIVIFSNANEYVYVMESGFTFDGDPIESFLYLPFAAINDPSVRKAGYKVRTFFDPEGSVTGTLTPKYDFNEPGKIQPLAVPLLGGGNFYIYGQIRYGERPYTIYPQTIMKSQIVGTFFVISLQYEFKGGEPFVLDTISLEYRTLDRK